ncbi:hypothetical protein [Bacillus sp. FSL W8-0672]|uniref:hypothetical protein n=1 Tax=Bacillus sp. FSL W8-0672 TaxID=2954628 RepID=UPI0030F9ABB0
MNLLLCSLASRNSASPNPLVDADANEATSPNLLADAGTGAFEGISHSFKTERNESAVYRQLAIAASTFRLV